MTGRALTFGSVCSGIEAASVAWEPLGMRPVWFAEIEPFPCAVLAHHWPLVPNLGDMTTLAARVRSREIPAPDVLVGGTPCQDFSISGLRAGLKGERGQLTLSFVELADAIDDIRFADGLPPLIVVWENVPGVLSDETNAFGCLVAALAGCDEPLVHPDQSWPSAGVVLGPSRLIAWREMDAQYFNLAQRRERVFVVASAGAISPVEVLFESEGVQRYSPPSRGTGEDVAGTLTRSAGSRGAEDPERGQLIAATVARTLTGGSRADGGRSEDDREIVAIYGGNNTGGAIEVAPALNAKGGSGRMDFESEALCVTGRVTHALKAEGNDASEDGTGRGVPIVVTPFDTTQITSKANRSHPKPGDPCHPLAKGAHPPAVAFAIQATALRENPNSGCDGVGVQADVAYTIEARAEVQAVCVHGTQDPIVSDIGHALGRNTGQENALLTPTGVRRLTPTECERLMGQEDGATLVPFRGKPAADGPRYKALGNSMATKCMAWIGRRIQRAMA